MPVTRIEKISVATGGCADTDKRSLGINELWRNSAVVFEEFRSTAGVMEKEGLLPNVQKEEDGAG